MKDEKKVKRNVEKSSFYKAFYEVFKFISNGKKKYFSLFSHEQETDETTKNL